MPLDPVIPDEYQTDRADLFTALESLLTAFIASESYEVGRKYWNELPDSFTGEGPIIAVGDVTEDIAHDMQLRLTTYRGTLWYIDFLTDRQEYRARVNRWADRMRDLFTYNAGIVGQGELRQVGLQEGELRQGNVTLGAPALTFEWKVQEGYQ